MAPSDVDSFIASVAHDRRRADAETLLALMARVTGHPAKMWGATMVGFDQYHYVYDSGREGDHFVTGFSPRKQNLAIYINDGFDAYGPLLATLGKHKTSVSCLYINKLADVDLQVLEELITRSYATMKARYGDG